MNKQEIKEFRKKNKELTKELRGEICNLTHHIFNHNEFNDYKNSIDYEVFEYEEFAKKKIVINIKRIQLKKLYIERLDNFIKYSECNRNRKADIILTHNVRINDLLIQNKRLEHRVNCFQKSNHPNHELTKKYYDLRYSMYSNKYKNKKEHYKAGILHYKNLLEIDRGSGLPDSEYCLSKLKEFEALLKGGVE